MIWLSCEFIPYYIKRKGKTQDICRNLLKDKKILQAGIAFSKILAYNTKRTICLIYSITERKLYL